MSIFLLTLFGRSATLTQTPEEFCTGVVSSVSISALEDTCIKVVSYVHVILCHGVGAILVHRF